MRFPIILLLILFSPLFGAVEPILPPEIATLKATYDKDVEVLRMQYEQALIKRSDVERVKLRDAEVKFTKAGNLDGALAVRKLTEALPMFTVPEAMKETNKPKPDDILAKAQGRFSYVLESGRTGYLDVRGSSAVESSGVRGVVTASQESLNIAWGNGTAWTIRQTEKGLVLNAPDGSGPISKTR